MSTRSASTPNAEPGHAAPPGLPRLARDARPGLAPAGLGAGALGRAWLALLLGAAALLPVGYLLGRALPVLGHGGWLAHFTQTALAQQALVSLGIALEAAAVAALAGALPAIVVSRHDFPGRGLVSALALLPLLLAPYVVAGTWTVAYSADFLSSRHALAIAQGLGTAPYVFIVFRIAGARIPTAYGELAAALGHGRWGRLLRVHLPTHAVPAAASLLIVFAQSVGDYAAAERLGIETLSVGMHNLWLASQDATVAAIVSLLLSLPTLALVAAAAWAATALMAQHPVPPAAAAAMRRPLPRPLATLLLGWSLLCSAPAFWVPELHTLRWAWLKWERTRFAAIPDDLLNAATTAACTVLVVVAVCTATAVLLRAGGRSRLADRVPWLFLANHFLPPLLLALAFVLMTRDGSVGAALLGQARDSRLLIVLSEALRFLPFAMLPMLDALRRTPPAMVEAARAFGAPPWRARAVAYAGQVLPALALGCALVFVEALKELDMSLTLQPFGYSSPALKIYAFSRHQNMDRAAVWVLISQALMLLPLWWLHRRMAGLGRPAGRGPAGGRR